MNIIINKYTIEFILQSKEALKSKILQQKFGIKILHF